MTSSYQSNGFDSESTPFIPAKAEPKATNYPTNMGNGIVGNILMIVVGIAVGMIRLINYCAR